MVGIIRNVRYNTALQSACLDIEIGSVGVDNAVKFVCSERLKECVIRGACVDFGKSKGSNKS